MAKLYELATQYRATLEMEPENEDEFASMMNYLNEVEGDINVKVENICRAVKNDEAEANEIFLEEKRLFTRRQALLNKIDRIKAYMATQLIMAGLPEVKAGIFRVSFKKNAPVISIIDESQIPECFWISQPPVIDKSAIKTAINNGEAVPGTEIVQKESLQIR